MLNLSLSWSGLSSQHLHFYLNLLLPPILCPGVPTTEDPGMLLVPDCPAPQLVPLRCTRTLMKPLSCVLWVSFLYFSKQLGHRVYSTDVKIETRVVRYTQQVGKPVFLWSVALFLTMPAASRAVRKHLLPANLSRSVTSDSPGRAGNYHIWG